MYVDCVNSYIPLNSHVPELLWVLQSDRYASTYRNKIFPNEIWYYTQIGIMHWWYWILGSRRQWFNLKLNSLIGHSIYNSIVFYNIKMQHLSTCRNQTIIPSHRQCAQYYFSQTCLNSSGGYKEITAYSKKAVNRGKYTEYWKYWTVWDEVSSALSELFRQRFTEWEAVLTQITVTLHVRFDTKIHNLETHNM